MPTTTLRRYGRATRKQRADELFAQLPTTPVKIAPEFALVDFHSTLAMNAMPDEVSLLVEHLDSITIDDTSSPILVPSSPEGDQSESTDGSQQAELRGGRGFWEFDDEQFSFFHDNLPPHPLTWDDVCPAGNRIEKIAEASYAEVYRIANEHGTSIIKVIRLESPIKPQTKAQQRSGLVDEEPHLDEDMQGELSISEWLADIPGFVIYKDRYVIRGKAPKALLETHQLFHRRLKRKDPGRLQFYPSPSRYLDETRFLVVELGDAGTALEDFKLTSIHQLWDVFLHTALALARAEDLVEFEHRDLHEGNLCIWQARPPVSDLATFHVGPTKFGLSGLDVTILDYGLSRATAPSSPASDMSTIPATPDVVANDLEKDLSLFQSTHAPQCEVYRQMRSYLLHGDRIPPRSPRQHRGDDNHHHQPAQTTRDDDKHHQSNPPTQTTHHDDKTRHHSSPHASTSTPDNSNNNTNPISWRGYYPYTNVLWLAYLYDYLVTHFQGDNNNAKKDLARFKRETAELWAHLDPRAPRHVLSFPSAGEVVRFAVEAGWVAEAQLVDAWEEREAEGSILGLDEVREGREVEVEGGEEEGVEKGKRVEEEEEEGLGKKRKRGKGKTRGV